MREDLKRHFGWPLVNLEAMPLILTSNEVIVSDDYDWEDIAGVQYHYPNGYRNLVRSGERFVYYRGVRRAGKKRGNAEYFGTGLIGEVRRDDRIPQDAPKKDWQWFCAIDNYVPFKAPVPRACKHRYYNSVLPGQKGRTTVGLGHLLPASAASDRVIQIPPTDTVPPAMTPNKSQHQQ